MAPLFSKVGSNKIWCGVQNEVTVICATLSFVLYSLPRYNSLWRHNTIRGFWLLCCVFGLWLCV